MRKGEEERKERREEGKQSRREGGRKQKREGGSKGGREEGRCQSTILALGKKYSHEMATPYRYESEVQHQFQETGFSGGREPP